MKFLFSFAGREDRYLGIGSNLGLRHIVKYGTLTYIWVTHGAPICAVVSLAKVLM